MYNPVFTDATWHKGCVITASFGALLSVVAGADTLSFNLVRVEVSVLHLAGKFIL